MIPATYHMKVLIPTKNGKRHGWVRCQDPKVCCLLSAISKWAILGVRRTYLLDGGNEFVGDGQHAWEQACLELRVDVKLGVDCPSEQGTAG